MEAEECTTRWKSLRDKFVREVKKVKGCKSGDAGPLSLTGIPFEHYQTQTVSTNDNLKTFLIKQLLYCM